MKRLASLFVVFSIFALSACMAQTTTAVSHDFERYIIYHGVAYTETPDGGFAFENSVIWADVQADRTIYTGSFTEASATVFEDGSLTILYEDGWNAVCPAEGTYYNCTVSEADYTRRIEVNSLLEFRNVVIMPAGYYPLPDYPVDVLLKPWEIFLVIFFGIFVLYSTLTIVSLPINRIAYRANRAPRVAGMILPERQGQDTKAYWFNATVAAQTIADDHEDRYGKQSFDTSQEPGPSLHDRFRVGWPLWVISLFLFANVLAAVLLW
ncbi:MAG TPA: hypothetical protein DCR44_02725 [Acholeplasmatales bacterium]|nr:MAG: hypothetical protein A2Y16_06840 [Tenericutes bacterium GWF2_57_13]HAQ56308.1 hypothetical protein [Acholeplasmatales bacterium]